MKTRKLPTKTYVGFGLSMLDRAVKEFFAERCKVVDLEAIEEFFSRDGQLRCAYCDAPDPSRWDHLHPVSKGGDTVPGNLVPACSRCDDSKQAKSIEGWALSLSKHSPTKDKLKSIKRRLTRYQNKFAYTPRELEKKLTPAQWRTYKRFRSKLDELRQILKEDGVIT